MHLLDTDTLSLYQAGFPAIVGRVDAAIRSARVGITVISVEEQISGWYRLLRVSSEPSKLANTYRRLAESVEVAARFPILIFGEAAIARYRTLRAMNLDVGAMDLKIAAIALEHDHAIVTRNLRDFRRVPGLAVEDWST